MSLNEKSKIIKIIQKDKLTENDKKSLSSLLSSLPSEDLIVLIGIELGKYTQNEIRTKVEDNKLFNPPDEIRQSSKYNGLNKNLVMLLKFHYQQHINPDADTDNKFCEESGIILLAQYIYHINGVTKTLLPSTLKRFFLIVDNWDSNDLPISWIRDYYKCKYPKGDFQTFVTQQRQRGVRMTRDQNKRVKNEISKLLDKLFGENPYSVDPSTIPSTNRLSIMFGLDNATIARFLSEQYLRKFKNPTGLYERFWSDKHAYDDVKKAIIFHILDEELPNYPEQKVTGITEFINIIEIKRFGKTFAGTIKAWVKEYLFDKLTKENPNLDIELANSLVDKEYSDIWYSTMKNPITYENLESFVRARGSTLITTKAEFDGISEQPTSREIVINCGKHEFSVHVNNLIYQNNWCPKCRESFCQKITNLYVQKIVDYLSKEKGKVREQVSFKSVFGITADQGGRLKLDNLAENVKITGMNSHRKKVELIINFGTEYDGKQHDRYPNPWHKNRAQFKTQQRNDNKKDGQLENYKYFIVRVKEVLGFDSNNTDRFQAEIIRQLQDWTGLKFDSIPHWIYDKWTDALINDPTGATVDVPLDTGAPFSKPWLFGTMDFFLRSKYLGRKNS